MSFAQTRRRFLTMTALAGAAGIMTPRRGWADGPALETTTVRLGRLPVICFAPQYVCEALLRAEGFSDVRYVDTTLRGQSEDLRGRQVRFPIELVDRARHRDRSRAAD